MTSLGPVIRQTHTLLEANASKYNENRVKDRFRDRFLTNNRVRDRFGNRFLTKNRVAT